MAPTVAASAIGFSCVLFFTAGCAALLHVDEFAHFDLFDFPFADPVTWAQAGDSATAAASGNGSGGGEINGFEGGAGGGGQWTLADAFSRSNAIDIKSTNRCEIKNIHAGNHNRQNIHAPVHAPAQAHTLDSFHKFIFNNRKGVNISSMNLAKYFYVQLKKNSCKNSDINWGSGFRQLKRPIAPAVPPS